MKKITIIGSGALGTAFANLLFDAGQTNVLIYGVDVQELEDLKNGKNTKYFPDKSFYKFQTTNDLNYAVKDTDYIVIALPSIVIDKVLDQIKHNITKDVLFINGSKGFYPNQEFSVHTGINEKMKDLKYFRGCVSLSGPSFAIEIINKSLTTICAISKDIKIAQEVQKIFHTNYFKLYSQTDVIGSEIGGIYKNILAIGAGIINQLGYKINTIASFLTRGMNEMRIFNEFMGGQVETIYGLTGLGDLILTATDDNSRNFTFGKNIVKNPNFINENKMTVEGLFALKIVEEIRRKNNLYLPIVQALYNIIYNNKNINDEINNLWNKELKEETI